MISGVAAAAKALAPGSRVLGIEVEVSCAFQTSVRAGKLVEIVPGQSLADGLGGNPDPQTITFEFVQRYVDQIVTVSESDLAAAIVGLIEHEHLIAEGAGAAAHGGDCRPARRCGRPADCRHPFGQQHRSGATHWSTEDLRGLTSPLLVRARRQCRDAGVPRRQAVCPRPSSRGKSGRGAPVCRFDGQAAAPKSAADPAASPPVQSTPLPQRACPPTLRQGRRSESDPARRIPVERHRESDRRADDPWRPHLDRAVTRPVLRAPRTIRGTSAQTARLPRAHRLPGR